jgi:hypothetical protein
MRRVKILRFCDVCLDLSNGKDDCAIEPDDGRALQITIPGGQVRQIDLCDPHWEVMAEPLFRVSNPADEIENVPPRGTVGLAREYPCEHCGAVYRSSSGRSYHRRKYHPIVVEVTTKGKKKREALVS